MPVDCLTFQPTYPLLSFFKLNDPFRLIGIVLLLLILRIPNLLLEIPLLQPELIWMLIGERMSNGYSMYVDIIDDTGTLSAGVYWVIHLAVGKSLLTYHAVAALIILFQASYINHLLIQYKAFEENTYIPALVMLVLFHLSFDFLTLSPALMGSTFILLALGQLFSQTVRHQDHPEPVFLVGLFGGIALCFHFPLMVFLPFLLAAGLIISGYSLNQLLLCLTGYFLPVILCGLYYFWIDGLREFLTGFIYSIRIIGVYHHVSYWDLAVLLALALVFTFAGFVLGFLAKRLTVNQQKQNQLVILYLAFSILPLLAANRLTPYQLIVLLPGLTYYISQIFIYLNRKKLTAVAFYTFLLGIPLIGYGWISQKLRSEGIKDYAVNADNRYDFTQNSSVLVLGQDLGYYRNASLAGPYLNYQLSKPVLAEYKNYPALTKIYLSFKEEKPEYIIDEEGVFAALLEHLPEIAADYTLEKEGIYRLK